MSITIASLKEITAYTCEITKVGFSSLNTDQTRQNEHEVNKTSESQQHIYYPISPESIENFLKILAQKCLLSHTSVAMMIHKGYSD